MRALLIGIALLLNGCAGVAYYGQAALGRMQVIAASRPMDDVSACWSG